ncbi:hypothetical protein NBRC10512_005843 [Rhodotorula toruloides]|uniref:RHTO0S08e03488g1_1 n=2 Tax=Rhodotorula toruloides TaxID=5286 RepID=A0A061B139_RHOTO|nr:DUF985 and Cupin, RmlC-type domain protein [Rhodotorula toruloides NP11]EMS20231.1 DUF985 and Cupin, RmlC-type domain protein [Rhodotorula toruloides NP11]CDR43612.1 RHTO0S08e03488g1_1 [Rhodotorula toruloides]
MPDYPYLEGNASLIASLKLQPHPEGGFFAETVRTDQKIASEFADGKQRNLATQIYYLLTPDSPKGKMHMNKSVTFHALHAGRALYTLVKPLPPNSPTGAEPEIKHVVMGSDASKGEVRQLFVEGGWWKASEIPEEDLKVGEEDKEHTGCLISEVVVPGFDFGDHKFLSKQELLSLFNGDEQADGVQKLLPYVRED